MDTSKFSSASTNVIILDLSAEAKYVSVAMKVLISEICLEYYHTAAVSEQAN